MEAEARATGAQREVVEVEDLSVAPYTSAEGSPLPLTPTTTTVEPLSKEVVVTLIPPPESGDGV